jgi:hypothetical protein
LLGYINLAADYILFAANFILLCHIWWGAYFLFAKISFPRNLIDWVITIAITASLVLSGFYVVNAVRWFALYGIIFSLVVLWYSRYRKYHLTKKQKKYAKTKIDIEKWSIPALFLTSLSLIIFDNNLFYLLVVTLALLFQIPFIIHLVFIKKIYKKC